MPTSDHLPTPEFILYYLVKDSLIVDRGFATKKPAMPHQNAIEKVTLSVQIYGVLQVTLSCAPPPRLLPKPPLFSSPPIPRKQGAVPGQRKMCSETGL
jgi:hypothetical protein